MADTDQGGLPLFPIQLAKVDIGEIAYSCGRFSDSTITPASNFTLNVAVSAFDQTSKALQVALTYVAQPNAVEIFPHEYSLRVTIHGQFQVVDEFRLPFPLSDIVKWAEKNAVIIMMPFLRESVYSITAKTGFAPIMIPMVEVAAFRVGAPNHAAALPIKTRAKAPHFAGGAAPQRASAPVAAPSIDG